MKIHRQQKQEREERIAAGEPILDVALPLPVIPFHQCRSIMTRTDFLEGQA